MKSLCINDRTRKSLPVLLATLLLSAVALTGCTSETETKMSEADKANFKGGPMPADFKDPSMPGNAPPAATGATTPAAAPPAAGAPAPAAGAAATPK